MKHNLIFDLGNVIIPLENEKHWWNEVFLKIFEFPEKIQELKENQFFVQYEKGEIETSSLLYELEQYLLTEYHQNDIMERWNALLKTIPEKRWTFLKELKSKYSIFLLSNTNEIHLDCIIASLIKSHGKDMLSDTFDHCYYSYKMKQVKPDAAIYLKVLQEQNLNAEDCIFFDDKMENLQSAKELGIHTHLIHPQEDIEVELKYLFDNCQ